MTFPSQRYSNDENIFPHVSKWYEIFIEAGECLERRTGRLDSELVRDEVEVELMKERALCDEIRQQFLQTLKDVELQLIEDKTAKQRLESDWSDKKQAFELDSTGRSLTLRSSILMFKPGSVIFPGE